MQKIGCCPAFLCTLIHQYKLYYNTAMNQSQTILLIEDDPAVARSLQDALVREGYEAVWKDTGRDGIAFARDRNPHLIILDVRLPDGSGFDFCRQRSEEHTSELQSPTNLVCRLLLE